MMDVTVTGVVVHGKHLGRTLGYPTANLRPDDASMRLGQNGVYVAEIVVEGYPGPMPCMVNQGRHPTVPDGPATIEAHILDFHDDIYDLRVKLTCRRFLRPERNFGSLDGLKAQLARDLESTRAFFKK